jgi:hypothetical protein
LDSREPQVSAGLSAPPGPCAPGGSVLTPDTSRSRPRRPPSPPVVRDGGRAPSRPPAGAGGAPRPPPPLRTPPGHTSSPSPPPRRFQERRALPPVATSRNEDGRLRRPVFRARLAPLAVPGFHPSARRADACTTATRRTAAPFPLGGYSGVSIPRNQRVTAFRRRNRRERKPLCDSDRRAGRNIDLPGLFRWGPAVDTAFPGRPPALIRGDIHVR